MFPPNYAVTPHHPIVKSVDSQMSILEREEATKSEIVQQISLLKRSIMCQEQRIHSAQAVIKTLLEVAKVDPASAAHALLGSGEEGNIVAVRPRSRLRCSSGRECSSVTLPYSKYCLQRECSRCACLGYVTWQYVQINGVRVARSCILVAQGLIWRP